MGNYFNRNCSIDSKGIKMPITGFRIFDIRADKIMNVGKKSKGQVELDYQKSYGENFFIQWHTGVFDKNGTPIYEGDSVNIFEVNKPYKINDLAEFLMMCGESYITPSIDLEIAACSASDGQEDPFERSWD